MVLFRPHRQFLDEAMKEVREISDLEEVRPSYSEDDILTLEYVGYDKRNNWDTWVALADGQAFGHTNGPLEKIPENKIIEEVYTEERIKEELKPFEPVLRYMGE